MPITYWTMILTPDKRWDNFKCFRVLPKLKACKLLNGSNFTTLWQYGLYSSARAFGGCVLCPLGNLVVFHCYLIATNTTTNEELQTFRDVLVRPCYWVQVWRSCFEGMCFVCHTLRKAACNLCLSQNGILTHLPHEPWTVLERSYTAAKNGRGICRSTGRHYAALVLLQPLHFLFSTCSGDHSCLWKDGLWILQTVQTSHAFDNLDNLDLCETENSFYSESSEMPRVLLRT